MPYNLKPSQLQSEEANAPAEAAHGARIGVNGLHHGIVAIGAGVIGFNLHATAQGSGLFIESGRVDGVGGRIIKFLIRGIIFGNAGQVAGVAKAIRIIIGSIANGLMANDRTGGARVIFGRFRVGRYLWEELRVVVQRVGCKRRFVFGAVVELSGQRWPRCAGLGRCVILSDGQSGGDR